MKLLKHPLAIIIGLYLIYSLYTLPLLGTHWDEPPQWQMGTATWDYVTGKTPTINFLRDDAIFYGSLEHSFNKGIAWVGTNLFGMQMTDAFHLAIPFVSILALFYLFRFTKLLTDQPTAIIATTIFLLSPHFTALGLYDWKETLLLTLNLITLYYLYQTLLTRKLKFAVFAGIAYGLSLGIQITSVIALGIIAIPSVITLLRDRQHYYGYLKLVGIFIITSLALMFATWPTLWTNPLWVFTAFGYFMHHSWDGNLTYFGHNYHAGSVPWHYPFFYILATIPVLTIIALITGLLLNFRRFTSLSMIMIYCWFFVTLILYFFGGSVRYDGARHYLDILPPIAILAATAVMALIHWLATHYRKYQKHSFSIILSILIFYLLFQLSLVLPYGDAYFNEVVQLTIPQNIDRQFEIEYWGETYREGVNWLNQNAKPNAIVCVPIADHLPVLYPSRPDINFGCYKNSNYLMFVTRWAYLPTDFQQYYPFQNLQPVYTIKRLNSDLLRIYQLPE